MHTVTSRPEGGAGTFAATVALSTKPAATEAMFLMMARVFDELGYRRYEWKCDALNAASRRAALRFGFAFDPRGNGKTVLRGAYGFYERNGFVEVGESHGGLTMRLALTA